MMASSVGLLLRQIGRRSTTLESCFSKAFYHQGFSARPVTGILTQVTAKPVWHSYAVRCMSKDARHKRELVSDSDSESSGSDKDVRKHKEKGTSEFWRLKMRTMHAILDINKDGVVSWDDFQIMGDRFIKLGHLDPQQQKEFRDTLKMVWEEQMGPADPYNMVNAYQYLDNMHHVLNDKKLKRKAHRFLPYLFKALDHDKSGEISVDEFKLFFKCLGLKEEDAVASFRVIDVNHDNCLSEKEFVKYGRQFFLTEDERKPSRVFWGPLVD